jgi:hypothetical protein
MADELNDTGAGAAGAVAEAAGEVLQSAFCGSLRSKKFFMLDGLANEAGQYLDASNHCWCRETHMVFGPDGGRARPERCVPGRTCYSSALGGD